MKEYIDRIELNKIFDMVCSNEVLRKQIGQYIDSAPVEDVKKVIHAKWIDAYPYLESNPMFMYGICSECGAGTNCESNYCHNCGAKMDEEV